MKLFKARFETEFCYLAENAGKETAQEAAEEEWQGGFRTENVLIYSIREIKEAKDIPRGWENSIPWLKGDNKTVNQILKENSQVKEQ